MTSLLFGIFILLLYSWKLGRVEVPEEPVYDIEYAQEIAEPAPEIAEIVSPERSSKVETNRAYNQAEAFIAKSESQRAEPTESTTGKLAQMNDAISDSDAPAYSEGLEKARKRLEEAKARFSNGEGKTENRSVTQSGSRKTTVSYRLVDRWANYLPNPVYTCEGNGKIVINITVNELGAVTHADFNKTASTTTNGCLIDSALEYALAARFTPSRDKPRQLGTVTYNFPGQQ